MTPPESTRAKSLSCIGDLEVHEEKLGVFYIPGNPAVMNTYSAKLSNWQMFIPDRSSLESKLRSSICASLSIADTSRAAIFSRVVKIGAREPTQQPT